MKRITFLFVAAFLALSVNLQAQSGIDKLFDKYYGEEGFVTVTLNQYMFEMMGRMDTTAQGREFSEAISKLENIRILTLEDHNIEGVNLYKEAMKAMNLKDYKELMTVKEEGTDLKFFVREKGDKINQLVMVVGGEKDDNAIIVINGEIDLASIGSIARNMHIDGIENLEKLNEQK